MKNWRFPTLWPVALIFAVMITSCAVVSRQRTLPPSVRTVYVPMFVNRSAEPGIAEEATVLTQKEFLADGRLELVEEQKADAVVEVTITEFVDDSASFDADDFPRRTRYAIAARVVIVQNLPGRPVIGGGREVTASWISTSDKRKITYEPEPDAKEQLLELLAQRIVIEVLTGPYTDGA